MNSGDWSRWPAPAKLNLFLRLVGRRDDGYHRLQTVFRLLDWSDRVHLRVRADGVVARVRGAVGVVADDDLAVRAARLLQRHTGSRLGADIAIDKYLPMGGGVGGGSSDAATVLVALNRLWGTGLDTDTLARLGLALGADVPLFVRGRSAWAEGVGEQLQPIELPPRAYVVVETGVAVATGPLFQAPELTRNAPQATISDFLAGRAVENAFEPLVRARHPAVAAALDWLAAFGPARLTGTGGCVFLECATLPEAEAVAAACPQEFRATAVRGVNVSPLQVMVEATA